MSFFLAYVDTVFLDLVKFFFLDLESAPVAVALVGSFLTGVNDLVFCFFKIFFLARIFWGTSLTAFAPSRSFLADEDRVL